MSLSTQSPNGRSVLARLRHLIPLRSCTFNEALRIAEQQALSLLALLGLDEAPIPNEAISELPRIRVAYRSLPMSGLSYWDDSAWVIVLNRAEPLVRQRFTLAHEFKHIVDHGSTATLYGSPGPLSADQQAERAADYFAGCLLMPRTMLKRAWGSGLQTPAPLAQRFETSERAISVRLAQVGLSEPLGRHNGQPHHLWSRRGPEHRQEATA